jgi:hypothetical protein
MKNLKLIGFLMIMASGLLFTQCTTETELIQGPQGVAGIDGADGANGIDGTNGVDGATSCEGCHSDSHRGPIHDAFYEDSGHANPTVMYNGMTLPEYANQAMFGGSCAQCHVSDGYVEFQERGTTRVYDLPTTLDCKTCHSSHKTFDFANDGADYALRTIAPITLITDATYTIDYNGTSNMCVDCHQPRTAPPASTDGTFTVTSTHWGPHHGPQSTVLEGIQGANIVVSGGDVYPAAGTAAHRIGASCVQCHMSESDGDDNGTHTWIQTDDSCLDCHGSVPTEVTGLVADMATLAVLLEAVEGVDGNGDPVHGIVHSGHPQEGTFTIVEAEAAWNYLLVMEDSSMGVHNPKYTKALIANSIKALQP